MKQEKEIKSKENSRIKLLKKLSQKKYREKHNQFIIENNTIIFDALKAGYDFLALFVTENFRNKHEKEYQYLKKYSQTGNLFVINEKINKCYSQLKTPSGISALYQKSKNTFTKNKKIIYLNGVNDPGNLGTIIRTMLAFGFYNLILDEHCADIYNAKTINAARDAIFKINILHDTQGSWLKKTKLPIYVSNVHKGKNIDDFQNDNKFCLVMGSEAHGVDENIIKLAKENIKIKINKEIESLNVAIATAIFLYKFK